MCMEEIIMNLVYLEVQLNRTDLASVEPRVKFLLAEQDVLDNPNLVNQITKAVYEMYYKFESCSDSELAMFITCQNPKTEWERLVLEAAQDVLRAR